MKIEMDDSATLVTTILTIVTVLILATLAGCHMAEETNRQAIKAGLIQKPDSGRDTHYWTKP